jgi:hypothetical protein
VQAAALAQEGSVEFARWPKTLSKKEAVDIVKKFWERKDKKEFNAATTVLHRKNVIEADLAPIGGPHSCASSVGSGDNKVSSNGTSSNENVDDVTASNCAAPSAEEASSNAIAKIVSCSPVNNDVSGGITAEHLEEIDTKWGPVVSALDPHRDVLLFPSDSAESASAFPWRQGQGQGALLGNGNQEQKHRWRLVVLEASWQHGKTMHRQVTSNGDITTSLPPSVRLILRAFEEHISPCAAAS